MTNETLEALRNRMENCRACRLHTYRTKIVFGQGNEERPPLMLIGEGPGADEDEQGLAFVGAAGKKLDRILNFLDLDREQVYISNAVLCLDGTTLVKLADGTTQKIRNIVNNKYDGEVLSYDCQTQNIVSRKIIGWHKNQLNGRKLYKLSYKGKKQNSIGIVGALLTQDHKVLTKDDGWVAVENLQIKHSIATGDFAPNPNQEQIIVGTLLGDATISRNTLQLSHCAKQKEWLELKTSSLIIPFGGNVKPYQYFHPDYDKWYDMIRYRTYSHQYFKNIKKAFYVPNKEVPLNIDLQPLGLAVWFLDDGYLKESKKLAEIATNSFNKQSLDILQKQLSNLGLNSYIKRNRIMFNVPNTKKLSRIIAEFVPPSMLYKILPEHRDIQFNSHAYLGGNNGTIWAHPIIKEYKPNSKTVFCIDVEDTHNFITLGGVVHNCRPPKNRTPNQDEIQACKFRLLLQIDEVQPQIIVLLGRTAINSIYGDFKGPIRQFFGDPLEVTLNKRKYRAFVTYHPSYLLRKGHVGTMEALPHWQRIKNELRLLQETGQDQ